MRFRLYFPRRADTARRARPQRIAVVAAELRRVRAPARLLPLLSLCIFDLSVTLERVLSV